MNPVLWLVLLLLPQVTLPRVADLIRSQRDDVELERLATRLGPARLLHIAGTSKARGERVAALHGLGLSGAAHPELAAQALLPLTELLSRTADEQVQEAGAQALLKLCHPLSHGLLPGDEPYGDELPQASAALLTLAGDEQLRPGLRAELLEAALSLPAGLDAQGLTGLAHSQQLPVRLAALSGLGRLAAQGQDAELVGLVEGEDPALATAAAAALCEAVPRDKVPPSSPLADKVRALAARAAAEPPAVRQLLAGCLKRLGTAADRALIGPLLRGTKERAGRKGRPSD